MSFATSVKVDNRPLICFLSNRPLECPLDCPSTTLSLGRLSVINMDVEKRFWDIRTNFEIGSDVKPTQKSNFFLIFYEKIVSKTGRVNEKRSNLSIFYQIINDFSKNMLFSFTFIYQLLLFPYFYLSK